MYFLTRSVKIVSAWEKRIIGECRLRLSYGSLESIRGRRDRKASRIARTGLRGWSSERILWDVSRIHLAAAMVAASQAYEYYEEGAQQDSGIMKRWEGSDEPSLGDTRPPS